ncbi:MAG: cation-translocating P-type ATPase [Ruminococcaceae bacterium]|nr:cation-translocating P-type ATPase [Oscillospiraceae bacterium]
MYSKLSAIDTAKRLNSDLAHGLTSESAQARVAESGANSLQEQKSVSLFQSILHQLNEPMIYILAVAAVISAAFGEWVDSLVILAIVVLNAVIGTVQEQKAEHSLEALRKLTVTHCIVIRDGVQLEISAEELAVGDIVLLDAGRSVPADLRLIETSDLQINESALTGESVPVEKDASFLAEGDLPLGDRKNMAFQGTIVTAGRARGIVIATGISTEVGRIAAMMNEQETEKTPLQKKLVWLSKVLGIFAVSACALILLIGFLHRLPTMDLLLTAVSLAVAVIPEGLTAIVTIVLALGVTRMVQKHAIVRRLPAVEALGSVTVICTDKTGTLTQNRMTVVSSYIDGTLFENGGDTDVLRPMLHNMVLCNDATVSDSRIGDPTELALLEFAKKHGITKETLEKSFPRVGEIPFDSIRKTMTTLHAAGDSTVSYTKGAVDVLLPNCSHIWTRDGIRTMTDEDRATIDAQALSMSNNALRVLAYAMRAGDATPREQYMVFLGLTGMIDPPRTEVSDSIRMCHEAGIKVVMITGDHKITAAAIGEELGLFRKDDRVLSGVELDALSDEELYEIIEDVTVFARVDPRHKVRIVNAFKARGHVVSMTGDGVNDAPSLKAADIGVAMGQGGTDAAKEASDIVLTDDRFDTIAHAVSEGRTIFTNIRKAIVFLLASNMGELFTVLIAVLLNWQSPLLPLHILWINLLTDSLPALALGIDKADADVMQHPPRSPKESLFANGGWGLVGGYGILIAVITLIAYQTVLVSTNDLLLARTCAFLTLALSQLFHSLGIHAHNSSVFQSDIHKNKTLLLAFLFGVVSLALVILIPPLSLVFDTVLPSGAHLLFIFALSLAPVLVHELVYLIKKAALKVQK